MTEIDLIPKDYRTRLWQSRWLKFAGVALGALLLGHGATYGVLLEQRRVVQADVAKLEADQRVSTQQRSELESLSAAKAEYDQQLRLLTGLRSGASAEQLFLTVERALDTDDVWFMDWRFQRSGIVVEAAENGVDTGYFIVVPAEPGTSGEQPWQVRTHMTIRGRSRDHSALSDFVKRLFAQPEIDDVHLGQTSMTRLDGNDLVDFDLAVVMNTNVSSN